MTEGSWQVCTEGALSKALWLCGVTPNEGWVAATSNALLCQPLGTLTQVRKPQGDELWALLAPSQSLLRCAEVPAGTQRPLALQHTQLRPIKEHPE